MSGGGRPSGADRGHRWGNAAVWAVLLLGSLLQQPGRTTFDTKFDLTADPAAFLGRALHLWNPDTLGELQNQAYGYLFPQGPYFLAAQAVHLPDWLAQRLWSALLLVVAYEGARRLCRSLGIAGGRGRDRRPRLRAVAAAAGRGRCALGRRCCPRPCCPGWCCRWCWGGRAGCRPGGRVCCPASRCSA